MFGVDDQWPQLEKNSLYALPQSEKRLRAQCMIIDTCVTVQVL